MEKILANHISDKRLVPKIYKELLELNSNKNNLIKTWAKELNKDHSTILYSIKKVEQALASGDTQLQDHIRDITANINSSL